MVMAHSSRQAVSRMELVKFPLRNRDPGTGQDDPVLVTVMIMSVEVSCLAIVNGIPLILGRVAVLHLKKT